MTDLSPSSGPPLLRRLKEGARGNSVPVWLLAIGYRNLFVSCFLELGISLEFSYRGGRYVQA